MRFFSVWFLCVVVTSACTKKQAPQAESGSADKLAARGAQIYKLNCIACHSPDPKLDGATGPAIAGSSLELLSARILKAQYPAGYKPKRDTKVMPPLPHLEPELPALVAYLGTNP